MHLNLLKKAFKKVLLISNGHQEYHDDLINISEQVIYVDPYSQEKNYLKSLNDFKEFLNSKGVNKSTNVIYGSGLEDKLEISEYLDNNFTIIGNSLSNFDFLSNIYNLNKELLTNKINLPELSEDYHYKFISKKYNSSGGIGVGNSIQSKDVYFQKYIPGKTYSISFIARYNKFKVLGYNQLLLIKDNANFPFLHSGAMTIDGHNIEIKFPHKWLNSLVNFYNLSGYCSIDFKIYDNKIFLLDFNPRLSSSYRLYKRRYNNLMHNHLGISDDYSLSNNDCYAYVIFYAKKDIIIDESIRHINDVSDSPKIGELIKKDSPIFTVNIHSNKQNNLIDEVKVRINSVMEIIDCYNTQLEYE
jgi:predicted ATP-grasp superfamily ATP-dependent carboligase